MMNCMHNIWYVRNKIVYRSDKPLTLKGLKKITKSEANDLLRGGGFSQPRYKFKVYQNNKLLYYAANGMWLKPYLVLVDNQFKKMKATGTFYDKRFKKITFNLYDNLKKIRTISENKFTDF